MADPSLPTNRILVKLHPTAPLRAAASGVNLQPLYERPAAGLALTSAPQWYIAELAEAAANPWDVAYSRVADQLGVAESDVIFAEPDIVHTIFQDTNEIPSGQTFAAGQDCTPVAQDGSNGRAVGPDVFAWHLLDNYSQLGSARAAVEFKEPRTRIAHIDTGYFAGHVTVPKYVNHALERSFVDTDTNPSSAVNPGTHALLLDNHDHGTGTLSIVAGGMVPAFNAVLGGAPDADVVPLRVADSVVLLRTSALARAIVYATQNGCDVITLSMGGLPSAAWAEAVDAAYEAGLCICAAAGNHVGDLPPKVVVYPARYPRVIAVCGVMADGKPYANLTGHALEGSYGPPSAMKEALAAFTPNIPWARFGCPEIVRLNGEGTSAATPQVAAAVALWFEKYKSVLPRNWERIEAVRNALFTKAQNLDQTHFGKGILRANDALAVAPVLGLGKAAESKNGFSFLRLITGLGITEVPARERMFNLEIAQRWLVNPKLQQLVPDPDDTADLTTDELRQIMDEIIQDAGASMTLRKHVAERYPVAAGTAAPRTPLSQPVIPALFPACEPPTLADPPFRRIRTYALDPSLSTRLDTADINEVALKVRWEKLDKGPTGEYVRVEDTDAAGTKYDAVDLDDPRLLAQDGWAPSEGNPQFHQQMVYAVAMKTIEYFEGALGRPVLWRPRPNPANSFDDSGFIRQLPIRPHALRQANAFYSPQEVALQFGYFEAAADDPGDHMPGSRIYSCLSHDIVAHETTHAIVDGMHRRFNESTNPDVLALHEAFADIVALMQHFTIREVLEHEIARTRGDIETESLLGRLAMQFGYALGTRGALRDAIGHFDQNGVWKRFTPDPADLQKRLTPHARGAILVGAVFDAFIAIYNERIADLRRIYTGGTGVMPNGAIHPDLVHRLADEASRSASHVLNMCIRALDYLPPVDVTFFEFLRALITADFDLVSDDRHNYRVAFVEAFRRRCIYPLDLETGRAETPRTLSVDTLRWQGLDQSEFSAKTWKAIEKQYATIVRALKKYANECFYLSDRETLFHRTRKYRETLHELLKNAFKAVPEFASELGLDPAQLFEVHALRRAIRVSPDGSRHIPQLVISLTQVVDVPANAQTNTPAFVFRGGSTLVVDLTVPRVKYRITKRIDSEQRLKRTAEFVRKASQDPLRALLFNLHTKEPFAALHALSGQAS